MVDYTKQDMTDIWASSGDKTAPDPSKIATGWVVEAVPRQWWNWFENRQDVNIAYMLQKGIPEWDAVTEYLTNKSYVQRNNIVYKCISTNAGLDPSITPLNWVKAFPDSTASSEALGGLTPAADRAPYFTGANTAALMTVTAFARTLLDDANVTAARATLDVQQANVNLTSLSGVTAATNALPYFTSTSTMAVTTLTSTGRNLIAAVDAQAARTVLSAQALNANLTSLSGLSSDVDQLPYFTGVGTSSLTTLTAFARTLLDDASAPALRTTIGLGSVDNTSDTNKPVSAATQTALDGKQPLTGVLTALSSFASMSDVVAYYNGTTVVTTALTSTGRSVIGASDVTTGRAALSAAKLGTNSDITSLTGLTTALSVPQGGTGTTTSTGTGSTVLSVSPALSGTPTAPTASFGTNTTQLATTAFVLANASSTPVGTIIAHGSTTPPAGYLKANGGLLNRTTYAALFAEIGTTYGAGDGSTTFAIPDLRGEFVRGFDDGRGVDTGRIFGSNQSGSNASHTHAITDGGHSHAFSEIANASTGVFGQAGGSGMDGGTFVGRTTSPATTGIVIQSSGGAEARPRNIALLYCIKY